MTREGVENEGSLTSKILALIGKVEGPVDTRKVAEILQEDHQRIVGVIKSLQSYKDLINVEQVTSSQVELTAEGRDVLEKGSYEAVIFAAFGKFENEEMTSLIKGSGLDEAKAKIGISKAVQNGWIKITSSTVTKLVDEVVDEVKSKLKLIAEDKSSLIDEKTFEELRKRKLVVKSNFNYFLVSHGPNFSSEVINEGLSKQETELTAELMLNKEYEGKVFKPYNLNALGTPLQCGHLHPIQKMRTEFLTILTEMGFSEMPTNRFVESSFWNFDTLFVPQKHPARDVQDTFFLSKPETCLSLPEDYAKRIEKVHSLGDYGSEGHGSTWKKEEAMKNVLRTHTTAVSARVLYELAEEQKLSSGGTFQPVKKFSIDRVFRNETLDATHLAEFHQVEGFVADVGLSLGHLIGVMKEFFGRLGISQLKFKPAYNPYTEPSLEVFAFHPGLKKWVEVGNSGVFRPEMLRPMGFPEEVTVIAWGLSLERPTMIRYGINNIRDLVGHKVDLRMVYKNGLCRLDKH